MQAKKNYRFYSEKNHMGKKNHEFILKQKIFIVFYFRIFLEFFRIFHLLFGNIIKILDIFNMYDFFKF